MSEPNLKNRRMSTVLYYICIKAYDRMWYCIRYIGRYVCIEDRNSDWFDMYFQLITQPVHHHQIQYNPAHELNLKLQSTVPRTVGIPPPHSLTLQPHIKIMRIGNPLPTNLPQECKSVHLSIIHILIIFISTLI